MKFFIYGMLFTFFALTTVWIVNQVYIYAVNAASAITL